MTVTVKMGGSEVEARILEVTRDLLADGGPDGLSMRAVAEGVGISATAIYHYFDNKQALVDEIVANGYRRFGEHMREAAAVHPLGSLDRIKAMGEAYIRFAMQNTAYFRVIFKLQNDQPRDIDEIPGHGGYNILRECVANAIESGEVREVDPDLAAVFLWTCVHGLVTLAMACHFQSASKHNACEMPASPLEMYRAFTPFIEGALRGVDPSNSPAPETVHKLPMKSK